MSFAVAAFARTRVLPRVLANAATARLDQQDRIPMRSALVCLIVLGTAVRAEDLPPGAVLRIGSPALRHNTRLLQVAWSPDGKRLASAAVDEGVKVWEPETGRHVASLPAPHSD